MAQKTKKAKTVILTLYVKTVTVLDSIEYRCPNCRTIIKNKSGFPGEQVIRFACSYCGQELIISEIKKVIDK